MNTCKVSLQCESSHAVFKLLAVVKSSHTQSTCTLPHQYVFSDVLLNTVEMKNSFHTNYMNVVYPLYELSGAASVLKLSKMICRIDHMCAVFSLVWMFM